MKSPLSIVLWLICAIAVSSAFAGAGPANPGPLSPYYLTAGDQGLNFVVQGNTIAAFPQHQSANGGEYAVVVTDTMRTLGTGNVALGRMPAHAGSEYTVADSYTGVGHYTGTDFPYPITSAGFFDGATDGRYNYAVAFYGGGVYRFNADWSQPLLLFATNPGYMGITWDPETNTLWLADFSNSVVEHRTMSGVILSSFPTAMDPCSLALDPADGTLWLTAFVPQGRLFQYTQAGESLGEIYFPELQDQDTAGGEFAVPAVAVEGGTGQGHGAISAAGNSASFTFSEGRATAKKKAKSSMTYSDPAGGLSFSTKALSPLTLMGSHAQFTGTAKLPKKAGTITFTVVIADLSNDGTIDEFSITASNGYSAAGLLTHGDILIQK